MKTVIVANGVMDKTTDLKGILADAELILSADGGSRYCLEFGIQPDIVVGDMDSLESDAVRHLQQSGVEIIRYPVHKDETDLELAVREAVQRGASDIVLVGALGARLDMTMSNIFLLTAPELTDLSVRIVDGPYEAFLLVGKGEYRLHGIPGDLVSLIPIAGGATGIQLHNLAYPLENENLPFATTRGISNVFIAETATVSIQSGKLLCVLIRKR